MRTESHLLLRHLLLWHLLGRLLFLGLLFRHDGLHCRFQASLELLRLGQLIQIAPTVSTSIAPATAANWLHRQILARFPQKQWPANWITTINS